MRGTWHSVGVTYEVSVEEHSEQAAATIAQRLPQSGIPAFLQAAFPELFGALQAQAVDPVGPPFARYAPRADGFEVTAGIPVSSPIVTVGRVRPGSLSGGTVATTVHVGTYDRLAEAFHAVIDWIGVQGYAIAGDPWESYLDGPDVPEPRTRVSFPVTRARA